LPSYDLAPAPQPLFPSSSCLSFSVFKCAAGRTDGSGVRGVGQIIRQRESLVLYKSCNIICTNLFLAKNKDKKPLHDTHREERRREFEECGFISLRGGGGGVEPLTIMPVQIFQAMGACWRAFMLQWAASSPPSDTVRYKGIIEE
jgi:hypothetical protein